MTLPSSFNHFLSAWESTPREQQTLVNLTSRLMMEEKRLNIREKSEGNAFLAGKQYKAEKGFFVGYDTEVKEHRIWFPDKNEVKIYRDIIFTGKSYKECQHEENKMKEDKSNSTFEIDTDEQSSYEENLQITEEDLS
ncbi:hypothetical protein CBL_10557 [Carabus blaptoides fortunei]